MNDDRATRTACADQQLAGDFVKHQGGCHGRARTLTWLDTVCHRQARRVGRGKVEIGEFVIQQKTTDQALATVHHLARAKGVLDGGGHGHTVAPGIDYGDVGGAGLYLGCGPAVLHGT